MSQLILDVIAKKNSRDLTTLADEFDRLSKQTDDAGKKMHETGTFSQFLASELEKTRAKVAELGAEFEKTGDKDVFAKLRGAQANVRSLESIGKTLQGSLEKGADDAGKNMKKGLVKDAEDAVPGIVKAIQGLGGVIPMGIGQAVQGMPPEAQAMIGAGVATAIVVGAPVIGAALGTVILGGIGLIGIGGAIALQMSDPGIQAAMGKVGSSLKSELTQASMAFGPVLINESKQFEQDFKSKIMPGLTEAFDRLAPTFGRLVEGFSGMFQKMMPGLTNALDAAGPLLNQLADELPGIGHSFSNMFDAVARGGPGIVMFFHDLILSIEVTVNFVGTLVEYLSKAYAAMEGLAQGNLGEVFGAFNANGDKTVNILGAIAEGHYGEAFAIMSTKIDQADKSTGHLVGSAIGLGVAEMETADATVQLSDAFDKLFHRSMSMDEAALRYKESITALKDELAKNTGNWNDNTRAGQQNYSALYAAMNAAEAKRQADIHGGKSASDAAKEYAKEADEIFRLAKNAGLSKDQLDALKGKYEIDILISTATVGNAVGIGLLANQLGHRAAGGPVMAGQAYIVGEDGPEIFQPGTSGSISPNRRSGYSTPVGAPAGSAHAANVLVQLQAAPGDQVAQALLALLRPVIRGTYGGDVTAALAGAS